MGFRVSDRIDEVQGIVEKSGNSFHYRTMLEFKERGWTVRVSPYYHDLITGKSRELDLIVERSFPVHDSYKGWRGEVNVRLFIECKYITQTTAFWFVERDNARAMDLVLSSTPCRENNTFTKGHSYLKENAKEVARLFADQSGKAAENEVFGKALNQVVNGYLYFRNTPSILTETYRDTSRILATLNYPVIVCNSSDRLYKVNHNEGDHTRIDELFKVEMDFAYQARHGVLMNEYLLIDIMQMSNLNGFLELIQKDVDLAAFFLTG